MRDFIFTDDVVDGMLLALESGPPCLPINLGSGVGITIKQLVETIVHQVSTPPRVEWDTSRPTGDPVRVLSTSRAEQVLGFRAKTSLEEGIRKTIKWYLDHRDLASRKRSVLHA